MRIPAICLLVLCIGLTGYRYHSEVPVHTITQSSACLGYPFLHFKIKKQNGNSFSNKDFKDKIVFVTFWTESSSTCKEEITAFNDMYEKLKDSSHFLFVAFTTDDDATIQKNIARYNIKYYLFHMKYKQCNRINYGHGIPSSFILNKAGKIVSYRPQFVFGKEIEMSEIRDHFYPQIMSQL